MGQAPAQDGSRASGPEEPPPRDADELGASLASTTAASTSQASPPRGSAPPGAAPKPPERTLSAWLQSAGELVPIERGARAGDEERPHGTSARNEPAPVLFETKACPSSALDFWGEEAATLHDPVAVPAGGADEPPLSGPADEAPLPVAPGACRRPRRVLSHFGPPLSHFGSPLGRAAGKVLAAAAGFAAVAGAALGLHLLFGAGPGLTVLAGRDGTATTPHPTMTGGTAAASFRRDLARVAADLDGFAATGTGTRRSHGRRPSRAKPRRSSSHGSRGTSSVNPTGSGSPGGPQVTEAPSVSGSSSPVTPVEASYTAPTDHSSSEGSGEPADSSSRAGGTKGSAVAAAAGPTGPGAPFGPGEQGP
jgi:hypothetical protein